jgi:hypothetical protein
MRGMTGSTALFMGAASAFSLLLNLGMLVAFLVVVLTLVRRHRPDAVALLVGALVLEFFLTCLSYAASLILPQVAGWLGGVARYAEVQTLNVFVFALAHAATRGLLLWGIVRLARPADGPTVIR